MTSVSTAQLPPAFQRAPKEVQEAYIRQREEGARARTSVQRWEAADKGTKLVLGGSAIGAVTLFCPPAGIALAGGVALTGCDPQKLPPEIPPRDFDTETLQYQKSGSNKAAEQPPVYDEGLSINLRDLSVKTGNNPAEALPVLTVGYTNSEWQFRRFQGEAQYLGLTAENFEPQDAQKMAFGLCAPNGATLRPADITGKTMAVMNPDTSAVLWIGDWIVFPRIYVKGDKPNPLATPENEDVCNPLRYLEGEGAEFFYDTGMTIQAPYYFNPDFQWKVFAYADRDVVSQMSGGTEGRIPDPDIASMRWWAWANDSDGILPKTWGSWPVGAKAPSYYNTISLISGASMEQKHDFFAGQSSPEILPGWPIVPDMPSTGMPQDGLTYFNTSRNDFERNGFSIPGRSYSPMIYVAPYEQVNNSNGEVVGNLCHRTENLHVQFMVTNTGFAAPDNTQGLYCNINFFQQNTE